jgi:hypothetical protein
LATPEWLDGLPLALAQLGDRPCLFSVDHQIGRLVACSFQEQLVS